MTNHGNNNIEVVGLQSPLFARARDGLANAILVLMTQLEDLGVDSGEINLKITIELNEDLIKVPSEVEPNFIDSDGIGYHSRLYKSPTVHHQLTSTIKQTTKFPKGEIVADGMELKRDEDGIWVLEAVTATQMKLE